MSTTAASIIALLDRCARESVKRPTCACVAEQVEFRAPRPAARACAQRGGDEALDTIFIEALRVETVIGVYDWERRIRQPVVIDLEMGTDIAPAAASDDVADALDYKAVSKRVQQFVGESSFFLVETLTERIATLILDEFPVPWVRVKLNKVGALRGANGVGVIVERGREPHD